MHNHPSLAWQLAQRALSAQKEDLRAYRNQASFTAALNGLVGTVFATTSVKIASTEALMASAPLLFLALFILIVSLLFSTLAVCDRRNCTFEQSPTWVLDAANRKVDTVLEVLATEGEEFFDENEKVVDRVAQYVQWSSALTLVQAAVWMLLLASLLEI